MKNTIIETKQLCKSYILGKTGMHVLKNINLEIYEGDFTVIMGSSGGGKSTLLYSISSMDRPTSGSVKILGRDVTTMSEKELSKFRKSEISFVFQSMNLLHDLTALENITYIGYGTDTKENINKKALTLLEQFGLSEEKDKYPSELSGGQQQRVAICRALIGGSKIIYGDEPTGALNSTTGRQVLDCLTSLNEQGQSIVMVTHDLKAAVRATRLLYMADGHIMAERTLGPYRAEEEGERKAVVYDFLKELGW
ncbi:ABC transporter ATP-binding protein [Anaerosporobacter faecicola]|uniref:ABC transporter ATP-binding protein n=1 Tax=Anaerosporobacter faecicola TaxID=2718714 RepID=UPI00143BB8F9|nr:ABC transporter ATP-binding protein [Anaerosporobacter faecicola]